MTEDEMGGWHHRLNGHEFWQAPGVGDRQGGLACCSSWGPRESDTTEQLNWIELTIYVCVYIYILYKDSYVWPTTCPYSLVVV